MSKPELSIIIPMHGEPQGFLEDTINSIRDTIDVSYELIAVDDCSGIHIDGVTMLRHKEHKGVGAAFDTGVAEAKSDNIFLMGSDIRFIKNNWASKMIAELDAHPKAISATTCIGLNASDMDINSRRNKSRRNSANILIFHDHRSHPKKDSRFRNILEAQWLPVYKGQSKESFEVPCILGAAYGVKKGWYDYIDGWWGHRFWGTLEPMISLKSWMMGGSCHTTPDIETGHVFKPSGTHGTTHTHLMYNKIMTAHLLFDEYDAARLVKFLGNNPAVDAGKQMFSKVDIRKKREEYKKKIVYDIRSYCKRFSVDFREELVHEEAHP